MIGVPLNTFESCPTFVIDTEGSSPRPDVERHRFDGSGGPGACAGRAQPLRSRLMARHRMNEYV